MAWGRSVVVADVLTHTIRFVTHVVQLCPNESRGSIRKALLKPSRFLVARDEYNIARDGNFGTWQDEVLYDFVPDDNIPVGVFTFAVLKSRRK